MRRGITIALIASFVALARAPSASAADPPLPASATIVVPGHGWGHARGLGQYGAKGMAVAGKTWPQIVTHYYSSVTLGTRARETIRVLVEKSSDTVVFAGTPVTARWSTGATIVQSSDSYPFLRARFDGSYYRVEKAKSHLGPWTFVAKSTAFVVFTRSSNLLQLVFNSGSVRYYRGAIIARWSWTDHMRSINEVAMEDYLYGVVPREMPASWPAEALRAQSVAARTYAAYKKDNARARDNVFDICATTSCQVYAGYAMKSSPTASYTKLEYTASNAAVDATAGKVLLYGGKPILAEFSSSTGGYSAPGSVAYLKAVPDADDSISPYHDWRATMRVSEVEDRWPEIGRLVDVTVTQRNGYGEWGGRVLQVNVVGTAGTVTLSGWGFKNAFEWPQRPSGVRSNWFTPLYWRGALVRAPSAVTLIAGETKTVSVQVRNTGTAPWAVGGPVRLAITTTSSPFHDEDWISSSRVASVARNLTSPAKTAVGRGEVAEFRVPLSAATVAPGRYSQTLTMVADGLSAMATSFTTSIDVLRAWIDEAPNLLANGSFEDALSAWTPAGFGAYDGTSSVYLRDGARSLRLTGGGGKSVSQTLALARGTARRFTVGGWSRAAGTDAEGGPVELAATAAYADGSAGTWRVAFPRAPHEWTYGETTFRTAPAKELASVTVTAVFSGQTGEAWFDAVRLLEGPLRNASFERGLEGWVGAGLASGDGTSLTVKRDGARALVITGGTKSLRQSVPLRARASERFVLSAWNRTVSSDPAGGPVRATLRLWHPDGTSTSTPLDFSTTAHDWTFGQVVAHAPKPVTSATVSVSLAAQTGTAWFDAIRVVRAWDANLSFEGALAPWAGSGFSDGDGVTTTRARDAASSLALTGGGRQGASQQVRLAGRAGARLVASAWTRASGTADTGGLVAVLAAFRHGDGTTTWRRLELARAPHGWTYAEGVVTAPKAFTRVDLYAVLHDQSGTVWFDGVALRSA